VRTIDTVGTKQLARLGPGQQFETIVRTDRGATKHVRFRHEGRR
jgi:hypothetical protein